MPTEQIDTSYLDQKLQSEINPELTMAKNPQTSSAEVLQHPPEVSTLREWGQYVLPEGKHRGKTFSEAFKDQNYVFQLRNRKAVSQWVKSFQMYSRTRVQADYIQSQKLQEQGFPVTVEMLNRNEVKPFPTQIKGDQSPTRVDAESQAWVKIKEVKSSKIETGKKRATCASGSEAPNLPMSTEPNAEKVQQLKVNIALLQRELARETQGLSDGEAQ